MLIHLKVIIEPQIYTDCPIYINNSNSLIIISYKIYKDSFRVKFE